MNKRACVFVCVCARVCVACVFVLFMCARVRACVDYACDCLWCTYVQVQVQVQMHVRVCKMRGVGGGNRDREGERVRRMLTRARAAKHVIERVLTEMPRYAHGIPNLSSAKR